MLDDVLVSERADHGAEGEQCDHHKEPAGPQGSGAGNHRRDVCKCGQSYENKHPFMYGFVSSDSGSLALLKFITDVVYSVYTQVKSLFLHSSQPNTPD